MPIRTIRTFRKNIPRPALSLLAIIGLCGCTEEVTDPVETIPDDTPASISGVLSREHQSSGTFSDGIVIWVDQDKMGDIVALRLGDHVDETPDPADLGDQTGFEFSITPGLDVLLFNAGHDVTVELLAEGGEARATAIFLAPALDVGILSPAQDAEVSHEGIDVQWRTSGIGTVRIKLVCLADESSWETVTENDGTYRISETNLAAFPKGPCSIEVLWESEALLSSVELGGGSVTLLMSGVVEVALAI